MSLILDGKKDEIEPVQELKLLNVGSAYKRRPFYNHVHLALDELNERWHHLSPELQQRWIGFIEGILLCKGAYKADDQIPSIESTINPY